MNSLVIFFPLFGALSSIAFGCFLGHSGAVFVSSFFIFCSLVLSTILFYYVGILGYVYHETFSCWMHSGSFYANWGFLFDSLTAVMLFVVTSVSFLVHFYSSSYIEEDPHLSRFMSYLSLFTFFMLVLVTADNFVQLFLGWEGVGLCSYLLINFWFSRIQANKAAVKAMLVNRIGDFGLALGIFCILSNFGCIDYASVFAIISLLSAKTSTSLFGLCFNDSSVISFFLFIGAVGKSAQLGLHTWLPDAIEGPTPVSALIHAATMVTAGVFLLARCSCIFELSSFALSFITILGAVTAFFAASTGLIQNDLKKVIAYSTCSQLGYIIFSCGCSSYSVGVFHLANHAFFKALLFLSAGSVIHAMNDEQDVRKIGGLVNVLPFTYAMFFIGSIALIGFPFLAGFYSKDVVLETAFAQYTVEGRFGFVFGCLAAFLTSFYSVRLIFLTFLSDPQGFRKSFENVHDSPFLLGFPLACLSLGSIFVGFLGKDMFIGLGTPFWGNSLFVFHSNSSFIDGEFLPTILKLLPILFSSFGIISSFLIYFLFNRGVNQFKISSFGKHFFVFLNRKWFFDKVYNELFSQFSLNFSFYSTYQNLDKGLIEILGPQGVTFFLYYLSRNFSLFQSGLLFHYLLVIVLGCFFFSSLLFYSSFFSDLRIFFLVFLFVLRMYSSVGRAKSF